MKCNKLKRFFIDYLITFSVVYGIFLIIFTSISLYVYGENSFANNLWILAIASCIVSMILQLVLLLDKITSVLQLVLVYTTISISVLLMGFVLNVLDVRENLLLLMFVCTFLILGLLVSVIVLRLTNKEEDKNLNANLKHFKERDR